MKEPARADIHLTCQCGHRFVETIEAITRPIACPACAVDIVLDNDHRREIERSFGLALDEARRTIEGGADRARSEVEVRKRPA